MWSFLHYAGACPYSGGRGAFFCLFSSCFPSFGPVILNPALHLFFVHLINGPHRFGVRCHVVIFIFFYGSLNHLLHYWDLAMHLGAPFVSNPTPLPDIHIFWLSWTADMRAAGLWFFFLFFLTFPKCYYGQPGHELILKKRAMNRYWQWECLIGQEGNEPRFAFWRSWKWGCWSRQAIC